MHAKSHTNASGTPKTVMGSRPNRGTVGMTDRNGMAMPIVKRAQGDKRSTLLD